MGPKPKKTTGGGKVGKVRVPKVDVGEASLPPEEVEAQKRRQEEDKAFAGRAVLDIVTPPAGVKYRWKQFNSRGLQTPSVNQLVKSFQTEGKHTQQSPIFVLLDVNDLVEGTYLKKDEDYSKWESMEPLKFKPREDGKDITVDFLSGQHRREAVVGWKGKMEKKRLKYQTSVDSVEGKLGGEGSQQQRTDLANLRDIISMLVDRIKNGGRWCVLLYDGEHGDATLWRYLSQNEYLPVLRATIEERVWGYMASLQGVVTAWQNEHPDEVPPKAGSEKWVNVMVRKVMTHQQQQAFSASYLLTTSHGWAMVTELGQFAALKSGRHVTIKLLDSVLKPGSRTNNQPCAFGEFWATLVRDAVRRMRFIASPTPFPNLDGVSPNASDDTKMLVNVHRILEGDKTLVAPDSMIHKRHGKNATYETLSEAEQDKLNDDYHRNLMTAYYKFEGNILKPEPRDVVWNEDVFVKIDELYCIHMRRNEVIDYMGHPEHEPYQKAIATYRKAVAATLRQQWKEAYKVYSEKEDVEEGEEAADAEETSDDKLDLAALYAVEERLEWTELMTKGKEAFDLPWPTHSFLHDLRRVLDRYSSAIQMYRMVETDGCLICADWPRTVRLVDPLVDSNIRRPDAKEYWDYGSYTLHFMSCPKMFTAQHSLSKQFYRWLFDHIPVLADVAVLLAEFITPPMERFYRTSHQQWVSSIADARKKDPTAKVLLVPEIIENQQLPFELTADKRKDLLAMSEYIRSCVGAEGKKQGAPIPRDEVSDHHAVGKIFSAVPIAACNRYPALWFMFRHAHDWIGSKARSNPNEAVAYAYLCWFGYSIFLDTTARIVEYPAGKTLHDDLIKFTTPICQPALAIEAVASGSKKGRVTNSSTWVNWDYSIHAETLNVAAERNTKAGRIEFEDAVIELDSVFRRQEYTRQMQRVVSAVSGLSAAQNGVNSAPGEGLPSQVANALDRLLATLMQNGQMLEVEHAAPADTVVVLPETARWRPIYVPKAPRAAHDHAYHDLKDFRAQDPKKYLVFRKLRQAAGLTAADRTIKPQQFNWKAALRKARAESGDEDGEEDEYVPGGSKGKQRQTGEGDRDDAEAVVLSASEQEESESESGADEVEGEVIPVLSARAPLTSTTDEDGAEDADADSGAAPSPPPGHEVADSVAVPSAPPEVQAADSAVALSPPLEDALAGSVAVALSPPLEDALAGSVAAAPAAPPEHQVADSVAAPSAPPEEQAADSAVALSVALEDALADTVAAPAAPPEHQVADSVAAPSAPLEERAADPAVALSAPLADAMPASGADPVVVKSVHGANVVPSPNFPTATGAAAVAPAPSPDNDPMVVDTPPPPPQLAEAPPLQQQHSATQPESERRHTGDLVQAGVPDPVDGAPGSRPMSPPADVADVEMKDIGNDEGPPVRSAAGSPNAGTDAPDRLDESPLSALSPLPSPHGPEQELASDCQGARDSADRTEVSTARRGQGRGQGRPAPPPRDTPAASTRAQKKRVQAALGVLSTTEIPAQDADDQGSAGGGNSRRKRARAVSGGTYEPSGSTPVSPAGKPPKPKWSRIVQPIEEDDEVADDGIAALPM
ncbi:hypothetical protein LXA43DRAFT_1068985 [Ganoderma leucocontextum]|nr:hypothetical protein LXA43DRAFT_1068985 [Ganoderma leucocontextum]